MKGCREEQATLGQLAAAGGVGRHGHPGNLWTLLILWILVNLSKKTFIDWYLASASLLLKTYV